MEKVKVFESEEFQVNGRNPITTTAHEKFVLHSDYARLEGLAREFAEHIYHRGEWIDLFGTRVRCMICGREGDSGQTVDHSDGCIVGKCETFLAGGI